MQIQTFASPEIFLEVVQPMLEAHETRNNLMLGVALRLTEYPEWTALPPYLAAACNETGQVLLAAMITPPRNILLVGEPSAPPFLIDRSIELVVENLREGNWPVPGVNAENDLSRQFAKAWTYATGRPHRVKMRERVYELREVIPLGNPPPGRLRKAQLDDLDLVMRWHYEFSMGTLGAGSLEDSRKLASQRIPREDIFLWEDKGAVSMAFRARPTPHGESVTGVYTPPDQRGHGYASACVAGVSQFLLDSGKLFCNLYTDLANPTSNSIYQKIGYQPVCDFSETIFEE